MNFEFPDDLKALRDEAKAFLADKCPPSVPRRILEGAEPYDRALWLEMAKLGECKVLQPRPFANVEITSDAASEAA